MKLKYLVVGTGRCGTVFMARLLTSLGIPCGHESIFNYLGLEHALKIFKNEAIPELSYASTVNWVDGQKIEEIDWLEDVSQIEAESSYMAVPFLSCDELSATKIIHIVRDPIKVIHSFCNHINYFANSEPRTIFEEFIYEHLPELKMKMSKYERASLYYVRWNEMIEKSNCHLFHRIEDGSQAIMDFVNKYSDTPFSNTSVNTYKKWTDENFNLHLVKSKEIRDLLIEMGKKYSYKTSLATFL